VLKPSESQAWTRTWRVALAAVVLAIALVFVLGLVSAQAESGSPVTSTPASSPAGPIPGPIQTHTNAGFAGTSQAFSVSCGDCHATHEAPQGGLLKTSGQALCASCHDVNTIHSQPATQQAVLALPQPVDCLSCHPHSSGFMPVASAASLSLTKQMTGYDDLDSDGSLSLGDRLHYRIDYANAGPGDVTGAALSDQPDTTYIAWVDAIALGATFDGARIVWNVGTLAAGATGYVSYDVLLKDSASIGAGSTTATSSTVPVADTTTTTVQLGTDITTVPESTTTTTPAVTGVTSSVDVRNTATLTADNRDPVSASATVTVALAGAGSQVPTSTTSTTESTTTTVPESTTTTTAQLGTPITVVPETTTTTVPVPESTTTTTGQLGTDMTTVSESTTTTTAQLGTPITAAPESTTTTVPETTTTTAPETTTTTVPETTTTVPVPESTTTTATDATTATTTVADGPAVTDSPPTTASATGPPRFDVTNTVSLTSDIRLPISASAEVSVAVRRSVSPAPAPSADSAAGGATQTTGLPLPETTVVTEPTTVQLDPFALILRGQPVTYDDLDLDGDVSLGDRVHYRVDYTNPGPLDVTGVALRGDLDTAHVASVEAISDAGRVVTDPDATIPTSVQWNIGTIPGGTSGSVTYDVILRDDPVMVRDDWAFPVQGPNNYSDSFGAPRYAGGYHPHTGTDIMCARGTPLAAVVDGVISRANRQDTGLGGVTIWLDGDDGNSYYYAHLSLIQQGIDDGVRVVVGQVIGFAGNTGDAAGGPVHLHFAIHPGGGPAIDPYTVLTGAATVDQVPVVDLETTTTTTVDTSTTSTTAVPGTDTSTTLTTAAPGTDTSTTSTTLSPATDTTVIGDTTTTVTDGTTTTDTLPPSTDSTTTTDTVPPSTESTATTDTSPPTTEIPTTVAVAAAAAAGPVAAGAVVVFALPGGAVLEATRRRLLSLMKARRHRARPGPR
jgi:predicted CXXCH cytochrome family protein